MIYIKSNPRSPEEAKAQYYLVPAQMLLRYPPQYAHLQADTIRELETARVLFLQMHGADYLIYNAQGERVEWDPDTDTVDVLGRRVEIGEDGLPSHLPMRLTIDNQGPANDTDFHHWGCWCVEGPKCRILFASMEDPQ